MKAETEGAFHSGNIQRGITGVVDVTESLGKGMEVGKDLVCTVLGEAGYSKSEDRHQEAELALTSAPELLEVLY